MKIMNAKNQVMVWRRLSSFNIAYNDFHDGSSTSNPGTERRTKDAGEFKIQEAILFIKNRFRT